MEHEPVISTDPESLHEELRLDPVRPPPVESDCCECAACRRIAVRIVRLQLVF